MDNAMALRILKNEKACVMRNISGCDRDCGKCDLVLPDGEILEGYDKAIEALQRLIPEKPLNVSTPVVRWGLCPNCKGLEGYQLGGMPNKVMDCENFCRYCGQALDWSET